MKRKSFMRSGCLTMLALAGSLLAARARAADDQSQQLVIYDNDWDTATSAVPLFADPRIKLLGLTVVTGDGWRDEETSHLLRFLELVGKTDVPVYNGAVFPLINTADRTYAWEKSFGTIPWKGAWNGPDMGAGFHAREPFKVNPAKEGLPRAKPAAEGAVDFLIRAVHEHPHQVTIYAAGPLTNIALAMRIDPQFASLAKQLVIMGGLVDTNLLQVTGSANFNSDFNFIFDPEAAHITLTGDWARVIIVGDVSNNVVYDKAVQARMAAQKTPAAAYIVNNSELGLPLWDEMAAALIVDPSLITKSVEVRMDVDTSYGVNYGHAHVWPESITPHLGETKVTIIQDIDQKRFLDGYVAAAGGDWSKPRK